MRLQFISDDKGNTTGVFIPVNDWQKLKARYSELEKAEAESLAELSGWQKQVIDSRLEDYYNHPGDMDDFDETLDAIEKDL